uniref:Uncharacterized protein n=1 Tax=viral metagenome TaxID=1070528 RepID=A0A6H1ZN71_9ZZZZ
MAQTIGKHLGEGFGKGELYAALAYDTSDAFGGMQIKGVKFAPVAGKPAINVGDSTTAWTALYGDRAISIYSTCADTGTGNAMPVYISATMSGTGGLGRALEAVLNVTGKLGSYGNALKGYINLTTGTGTSGLASAVCAEMKMPAGTALGTFGVLELELVAPASGWTAGQGTGTNCISWIYAEVSGTLKTQFNEYGYLFNLQGLTSSTTDLLYNNTLKCAIGSTKWYIPLSSAEGSYTTAYPIVSTSYQTITNTGPTSATNAFYSLVTADAAWTTGSIAAVRGRTNVTMTGAGGNVYGGWFGIKFVSGAPTGLGLSTGLYAEAGSDITGIKVSSVLQACLIGNKDMTGVPILVLQDNVTGTQTNILLEVGFAAGASTVSTGAKSSTTLVSTGLTEATAAAHITAALRVQVNGTIYWLPLMDSSALA